MLLGAIAAAIPAVSPCLRPLPFATELPSLLEFSGLSESNSGSGGRALGRFQGPANLGFGPFTSCCCCDWDGVGAAEHPDPGGGAGK